MIGAVKNFDEIEAGGQGGSFERLPAGGYIVKLNKVEAKDVTTEKPYLEVVFDIAEGEKKGFFANTDDDHEYIHTARVYFSTKAMGMFKGFLKAVDESNKTRFCQDMSTKGIDEKKLAGKLVGGVVGYKEKVNERGEVKQRSEWSFTRSVQDIRDGKYKVPALKKLEKEPEPVAASIPAGIPTGFSPLGDDDVPF